MGEGAPTFVQDLALVIGVAAITAILCHRLRQPFVLGYLLAGLIVGPYLPIPLFADQGRVEAMSDFGVVFVMFSVGLGFSIRSLVETIPKVGLVLVIELGFMGCLGWVVGRMLGWSHAASVFSASIFMVSSSTMIVAKVFDDQKVRGEVVKLVFGLLLLQDMVAVLLMTGLTTYASGASLSKTALADLLLGLGGFLLAFIGGGLIFIPRLFRWLVKRRNLEVLTLSAVALCLCFASLASEFKYSVALGAFIAGSLIAESGQGTLITRLVRPLRDVFAAVFFVAVGMTVDPRLLWSSWDVALIFAGVAIVGQFLSVSFGGVLSGSGIRTGFRAGLSLGQVGEFCFIIAGIGQASGLADPALYPSVVAASVITTFTTPLCIRHSKAIAGRMGALLPDRVQTAASLYAAWLQSSRSNNESAGDRSVPRRTLPLLALNTLLLAVLAVSLGAWGSQVVDGLTAFGKLQRIAGVAMVAGVGFLLCLVPFLAIVRLTRQLASHVARFAIPKGRDQQTDAWANLPRRFLQIGIQAVVAIAVAILLLFVIQPFVPYGVGPIGIVLAVAVFLFSLWRGAGKLEAHLQERRRAFAEESAVSSEREGPTSSRTSVLEGFGDLTTVRIGEGAPCVGKTLAELDLRRTTGCQVLVIKREGERVPIPRGDECVCIGDVLTLAGTPEALTDARKELLIARPTRAPEVPSGGGSKVPPSPSKG